MAEVSEWGMCDDVTLFFGNVNSFLYELRPDSKDATVGCVGFNPILAKEAKT